MANEEHVERLKAGVKGWNAWRKRNPEILIDLTKADLSCADLTKADLSGADLRRADLTSANLRKVDLIAVNLSSANLSGAGFSSVLLYETIFANVDLSTTKELCTCRHLGPSIIDHRSLKRSGQLPISFLRGVGLPDMLIDYLPSLYATGIEFFSCFISYSNGDAKFVQRLYDALQGRGIRCWLDKHEIFVGDKVSAKIDEGVKLYDKVLLCCSEMSLGEGSSWWVEKEVERAFKKERELRKKTGKDVLSLFPLNLDGFLFSDGCDHHFASDIQSRNAADFTEWDTDSDKFEAALEKVIAALRSDDGARRPPPKPKPI